MRTRIATAADVPALHALIESAFRGESAKRGWSHEADLLGGQRTDVAALTEIVGDTKQSLIVCEDDAGAVIACTYVADKGVREGARIFYLGMLTVRPDLQAGGLGRALLWAAEEHARGFDADVMEITVIKSRQELIDWYIRRGYALTAREEPFPFDDERFGLPKTRNLVFVVMAKALRG